MKKIYLFLVFKLISVHSCHCCLNFSNNNVTFNATNFEYILHWSKHDLARDVSFNVQYKRYGQAEWLLLHGCQNITRVHCNLTNAIIDDVEEFMENQYFGRVMAFSTNCTSDWVISKRLNPRDDTYLILPKLNYIQHVNSITILMSSPSVPKRGKDKWPITVEDLYKNDRFEYHLNFFNNEKQDTWQKTQTDRMFEVSGLSSDREYNGSVYVSIGNDRRSAIQYFMVRTLPDYSLVMLIACFIAVFVTILGGGLLFFSCKYLKQQVKTPHSLAFKKSTTLPLMILPKEKVISSFTVGFCPSTFVQNYEQKDPKMSRKTWQEISGNSQLQMYASQSHGGTTPGQDSTGDTSKSYCPPKTFSSPVSSVHYSEVLDKTRSHVPYLQNTTSYFFTKVSEGEFEMNTHQAFAEDDGDVPSAFIDDPFKFNLLSSLCSEESTSVLNSISPLELLSSVKVRDDGDSTAHMEQTTEDRPMLQPDLRFDGYTCNQMEEHNPQHSLLGHGGGSYVLQSPVENSSTDALDRTNVYKKAMHSVL
ncbi:interleukin-22 receptor subunit alpha-1 isoform X1 [Ranitomeya variabilis]|uniref:interleukin-22 receptor subunit alpha-1 isoform X1 n=2 Tax=Ranitomeya variabilis TaxID=490064 RepID=UPI004056EBC5